MMDELTKRGVNPVHCPRGKEANRYLSNTHKLKGVIIVASMSAHSIGNDLQHGFCKNYYLQSPVSATIAEQSIGALTVRARRPMRSM